MPDAPGADLLLFDLDDTLFDHTQTVRAVVAGIRRSDPRLQRVALADLLRVYARSLTRLHPRVMRGEITQRESRLLRWRALFDLAGAPIGRAEAARLAATARRLYVTRQRPVPGARALLAALHGRVPIVIASYNRAVEQRRKLRTLGFDGYVDLVVGSDQVGFRKPDPRFFRAVLQRAGGSAERTVLLGDSWEYDVVGATRAGLPVVWFNRWHEPAPGPLRVPELFSLRPTRAVVRFLLHGARGRPPTPRVATGRAERS